MDFLLNFGLFADVFAVPAEVVDKYINEASPDDIKVLLYILRHRPKNANDDEMSKFLGLTKEKIKKSVDYWAQKGLFAEDAALCAAPEKAPPQKHASASEIMQNHVSYSANEIDEIAKQNPDLKFLFSEASQMLGRLLTSNDCSILVNLFSGAGLPADVILMLIEYCTSINKCNINYIQKTGLAWADEGINTHELAENKICRLEASHSFEGKIRSIMGIGTRSLTTSEQAHILRWNNEFHSSIELVSLAYEICVNRLGKISFAYINSVLKSWHESGITSPQQVKSGKPAKKKGSSPSFDVEEYTRLSMKRLQK